MRNYIEELLKIQITLCAYVIISIYLNAITLENKIKSIAQNQLIASMFWIVA